MFILDYVNPQLVRLYLRSSRQQRELIQDIIITMDELIQGNPIRNIDGLEQHIQNVQLAYTYNNSFSAKEQEDIEDESTEEYFIRTYNFQ